MLDHRGQQQDGRGQDKRDPEPAAEVGYHLSVVMPAVAGMAAMIACIRLLLPLLLMMLMIMVIAMPLAPAFQRLVH
jgi:hypothetical protein